MNFNIFRMSLKQHKKSTALWTLTLAVLIVLGMAFYPAISQSLSEIEVIFENPMMKGLLSLFAVGPDQLGTLSGFYMTYASIYVILIGGIFSMMTAVSDVGGELRDKTFEYLLTKPVKRSEVLISKGAAIFTRLLIVTGALCLTTLLSFHFFSKDAPLQYYEEERALENVTSLVEAHPERIQDLWVLNEDFFTGWLVEMAYESMPSPEDMPDDMAFSQDQMADLLKGFESDPQAFLEGVLDNPEKYMDLFGVSRSDRQAFLDGVSQAGQELEDTKIKYESDPVFHGQMFASHPEYFLRQIKSQAGLEAFKASFPGLEKDIDKVIASYKAGRLVVFHTYLFLFMMVMSCLGMLISVFVKNPKNTVTIGTGAVLVFYFLSTLMNISKTTSPYAWISPFGLIDQAMGAGAYSLKPFNVSLLVAEALILFALSVLKFQKRDV